MADEDVGVTDEGFVRKRYTQIRDRMLEDARSIFGSDWNLTERSVVGMFIRAGAFVFSRVWDRMADVYQSAFIRLAGGAALDLATDYAGIDRFDAARAEGIVTIHGTAGTTIPAGERVGQADDPDFPIFETRRERAIKSSGFVDVFVDALEAGAQGNVGAGAITDLLTTVSGVDSVDNTKRTQTLTIGDDANATSNKSIAVGESGAYQTVSVADLEHEILLNQLVFRVNNPSGGEQSYRIRVRLIDDDTGEVIQNLGNRSYTIAAGTTDLTFGNFEADVHDVTTLRVEFFLEADSDGALEFVVDTSDNYANGAWHEGGTAQTGEDLVLDIRNETLGDTRDGRDRETDAQLRRRYFDALATSGAGTLPAIESALLDVDGVRTVLLRENTSDSTVNGLPPKSFEATVLGGADIEVAQAIVNTKPAGIEDVGTTTEQVLDENDNARIGHWERPTKVFIEIDVTLTTDRLFPGDGQTQVKNNLIEYVGGTDVDGDEQPGLSIGDDVWLSRLVGAAVAPPGVVDAAVTVAKEGNTKSEQDITIASDEVARTSPGRITVTVS